MLYLESISKVCLYFIGELFNDACILGIEAFEYHTEYSLEKGALLLERIVNWSSEVSSLDFSEHFIQQNNGEYGGVYTFQLFQVLQETFIHITPHTSQYFRLRHTLIPETSLNSNE